METGKQGLAPAHMSSVAAQTERRMDVQAPLTAVYFHTVPPLPTQPFPQPPFSPQDPSSLRLTMPPLYSKEALPFLTLHIASGLQPGMSVTSAAPATKPKSSGKHICPHCGRDCMKPSVLEKHLRCHTGERPYPCTVCGVSFKTQSNLYKHKRTQAHARLSSESEHSTLGSLDSMSYSTETTSLSVEDREESVGAEREDSIPVVEKTPVVTQTLEQNEQSLKQQEHAKFPKQDDKSTTETEHPTPPSSRHVLLQRQEATLFSKQWESSVSSSKSQSHESTDSGFSESSDHYPSPGSLLPDHSMDSLTESTTEHLGDSAGQQQENLEVKDTTKEQEHKTLEERISKLISENSAVVEDKHLENVRPRKTVLSKQGSIDLPMPYTYKDSFHFDMRINKMSNIQRNRKPGLYSSVPTQQSTSMEHAPLTRSNSLPFSVTLLQPDRSTPTTSSYHKDYTTLFRRGSSGQIHPTGFSIKSVNQQLSSHRPLVRQTAVDCNHATDGLFKNSSVEEACTNSLHCNGEPADICAEPSNRKFRRKKAQKFAYNKWYMYGGGTFKKLYETENSTGKGMKSSPNPESEIIPSLQKRLSAGHTETTVVSSPSLVRSATVHSLESSPARLQLIPSVSLNSHTSHMFASSIAQRMPLRRNLSLSVLPLPILSLTPNQNIDPNTRSEASKQVNERPFCAPQSQVHIPSDRKKQRTDDKPCSQEMETDLNSTSHHPLSISTKSQPNLSQIINQPKPAQVSFFPASTITANAPSVCNSPATSVSSSVQSSFMPKYQLKLPSAAESNSNSSLITGAKSTENIISAPVSSVTTSTSTRLDTDNHFSSAPSQLLPHTVSHTKTSSQVNVISPSTIVQQHPMADTKTTASLRNSHAGLFNTLIQCSPLPTTMSNKSISGAPFTSIHRTQSAPAAFTAFTQSQQHLSSQKSLPSPLTQSSHSSGSNADPNIPVMPCQTAPSQQAVPKVFHVQTADLQICFQIISDEQLALIEPQIEKQTVGSLSETGEMPAMGNQVQSSVTPESTDKESDCRQSGQNEEMDTLTKASAKPSISNKSEKEQLNAQMTMSTAQSPTLSTHPHICNEVNKVKKPLSLDGAEVSTTALLNDSTMPERSHISQSKQFCHYPAQELLSSDAHESKGALVSHAILDEQKPSPATVTSIPHSPRNNVRTNCEENEVKAVLDTHLNSSSENKTTCSVLQAGSDCGSDQTCTRLNTRNNLQLSMVSLSLSQTNPSSEKLGVTHSSTLTTASSEVPLEVPRVVLAASPNLTTGPEKEGAPVGCIEPQSQGHYGAPVQLLPEQRLEPLGTERDGFCYIPQESKVENRGMRADSFPTCWLSEQHLQPPSKTRPGMCASPIQSSGPSPDLSTTPGLPATTTTHTNLCSLTSCCLSQRTESVHSSVNISESNSNKLKDPQLIEAYQTLSPTEGGYQEIRLLQQDQRQVGGADNAMVGCSSSNYTSQSHTAELLGNYHSSSLVFNNPLRQSNTIYSESISQDGTPQSGDSLDGTSKFPSLFGISQSYSYQLTDPQSNAVRVVQSSVDVEDSSSDDEGKLIIEL